MDNIEVNQYDIDVINMSYGTDGATLREGRAAHTKRIQKMDWITFVPSAGNDSEKASDMYPAKLSRELDNVITVGGANSNYDNRWATLDKDDNIKGSHYGEAVTIAAPAEEVWTVDGSGNPVWRPGTSYAAPIVSGTVALLKSINPEFTPQHIKQILIDSADEKHICTETDKSSGKALSLEQCPDSKEEPWQFLRADRAVANTLLEQVRVFVGDALTIPTRSRNKKGNLYIFGVPIINTGEIDWRFYAEAEVTSPDGNEIKNLRPRKAIKHMVSDDDYQWFYWGFFPPKPGCYDLKITVSMDEPNSPLWNHLLDEAKGIIPGTIPLLIESDQEATLALAVESQMELVEFEMKGALDIHPDSRVDGSSCPDARGVPLGVRSAGRANAIILSDTSGSMDGAKIESLRGSIIGFVQGIDRMKDSERRRTHIGLTEFNSDIRQIIAPAPIGDCEGCVSDDDWEIRANSLDAGGGTALYDSIAQSVRDLENQNSDGLPRSTLIVLTDGEDSGGGISLGELKTLLGESSVILYIVAYGDYKSAPDALRELAEAGRGDAYTADESSLQGLYALFSSRF